MRGFSVKPRVRVVAAHRIDTDRLILRSPAQEDAARLSDLMANWDVAHWLVRVPFPYRIEHATAWIERSAQERKAGVGWPFLIVRREDDLVIGSVDLSIEDGPTSGSLGYWIGADYWGHGYATEAARAIVGFAFDQLALKEVTASALLDNRRSIHVLEKAGLIHQGRRVEDTVERGRVDTEFFALRRTARRSLF